MAKKPKDPPPEDKTLRELLALPTTPSRDALPYTDEFQELKSEFTKLTKQAPEDAEFWRHVVRIAKSGGLAKKGPRQRAKPAPSLPVEQQLEILRLLPDGIGNRDSLPYTKEFDRLHLQFSRLTKTRLTKYEFWRVLSRLAKRSRKPKPVFTEAPLGELPDETVKTLQRLNPWWQDKPAETPKTYRRWAFDNAWRRLELGLTPVVAIRGPRQVGKTMILRQMIEHLLLIEGLSPAQILRVQFDEVPQLGSFDSPALAIVRWFETHVLQQSINRFALDGKPVYLFFDEMQNLKDWAPELKLLGDTTAAKILVTGSSSLRILRGRDSLAGRLSMIELGPLRLREIAGIRRLGKLPVIDGANEPENWATREFWMDLVTAMQECPAVLKKTFQSFSQFGGYPVCHKDPKASRIELAESIVDAVVERTIEHDQAVYPGTRRGDGALLRETFRQVCRYAGQSVRPDRICGELNKVLSANYGTTGVRKATEFLVDSMLVHRVDPLEATLKKQSSGPRLCLCDHFVREAWLQERVPLTPGELANAQEAVSTLAGQIMQSVLGYFLKGIHGLEVSWFPQRGDEPEVDYVLTIGLKRIPVEVKYTRGRATRKDLAGLESFCRVGKYNAPFGLLITQQESGPIGDNVLAVPAAALLSVL